MNQDTLVFYPKHTLQLKEREIHHTDPKIFNAELYTARGKHLIPLDPRIVFMSLTHQMTYH